MPRRVRSKYKYPPTPVLRSPPLPRSLSRPRLAVVRLLRARAMHDEPPPPNNPAPRVTASVPLLNPIRISSLSMSVSATIRKPPELRPRPLSVLPFDPPPPPPSTIHPSTPPSSSEPSLLICQGKSQVGTKQKGETKAWY
ncbi:hypothetical protein BT67DRAFT_34493 [Trichocladium antarcticum]|uniref:Uncharacterized protein n=1 Tax=Trichocladium antarcticum TaxID=1450529 RepID=A0AAN6ZDX0_9PEZI|nr:hypothetical protein BT67DRAFT_34493 [Trichocladium antarcticum]